MMVEATVITCRDGHLSKNVGRTLRFEEDTVLCPIESALLELI